MYTLFKDADALVYVIEASVNLTFSLSSGDYPQAALDLISLVTYFDAAT